MSESNKTYINIGLVGHVSNGKTTLVKCLTGVNTKRNSNEIKSGRTIKLGYANCLVWKCPICATITTTGQSQKKVECCSFDLEPTQYISFVDSPGHHSFVQTMIKGSSIIDCAIVVTDVRANSIQPQTMEHLAILEILGVRNIIVIQNKVDLVSLEDCKVNYAMLQKELKNTVADGAPIIPISAVCQIGISYVQEYIYRMVNIALQSLRKTKYNLFTIVRSFDVNHPNTGIEDLKGGVLGGTVTGECGYKVGDDIEIRPGLVVSKKESIPLHTKVVSIFSETKSCSDTGRGGLYGLGTKLDPTLTKADRLEGSVAGRPQDLPPVITTVQLKIFRMKECIDGSVPPKIKTGLACHLIFGSTVIKAVVSKQEDFYLAEFDHPVCISTDKCLIYVTETMHLIGFGIRVSATVKQEEEKVQKIAQNEEEYVSMLPGSDKKEKEKMKLPVPSLSRENMNTLWINISDFCKVLNRDEEQIVSYIKQELRMEASICQNGLRLYKAKMTVPRLQTVLRKYIKENVCCDQCKGVKTIMEKNPARGYQVRCVECHSERCL